MFEIKAIVPLLTQKKKAIVPVIWTEGQKHVRTSGLDTVGWIKIQIIPGGGGGVGWGNFCVRVSHAFKVLNNVTNTFFSVHSLLLGEKFKWVLF